MKHALIAAVAVVAAAMAVGGSGCEVVAGIQERTVAGAGGGGTGGEEVGPGSSGGRPGTGGLSGTGSGGQRVVTVGSGGSAAGTGGVTGSGGRGSGGVSASGGRAGTGGAASGGAQGCVKPTRPLITDFSDPLGDESFGVQGAVVGVVFHFGAGLTHDTAAGALRTSGTLTDSVGGMGFAFTVPCVDASAYSGVSFTISGTAGVAGLTTLNIGTRSNEPVPPAGMGLCRYTNDLTRYTDCRQATKEISISSTPTTMRLSWNDLTGGQPMPSVDPTQLLSVVWVLPYVDPPSARAVDVTVDDLRFW